MTSKCKHNEMWARCSVAGHKDGTCAMAFKCVNCGENHAPYNKKCSFYNRYYDIQSIRVSNSVYFFETRKIHQQTHGQRVMNYAGSVTVPIQRTLICTQTDVSWVGLSLLHGSSVLLLLSQASSVCLTISGNFHSCGGCEENSQLIVTSKEG